MQKTEMAIVDKVRQDMLLLRATICGVQSTTNALPLVSSLNFMKRVCDESIQAIERYRAGCDLQPQTELGSEASEDREELSGDAGDRPLL